MNSQIKELDAKIAKLIAMRNELLQSGKRWRARKGGVLAPATTQELTPEKVVCSKMETTTWNGNGTPPVGAVCEIYLGNYRSDRRKSGEVVKVLATAKNSNDITMALVEICEKDGKCDALNVQCLRPFHDERDVFIEKASKAFYEAAEGEINDHAFGAIYDALKSGALKVPKVK